MKTLKQLEEYAGGELEVLLNEYLWMPVDKNGQRFNEDIKIKVFMNSRGKVTATPSHMVKNSQQASPYMSLEEKDSGMEAVEDCIRGFNLHITTVAETAWIENPHF